MALPCNALFHGSALLFSSSVLPVRAFRDFRGRDFVVRTEVATSLVLAHWELADPGSSVSRSPLPSDENLALEPLRWAS